MNDQLEVYVPLLNEGTVVSRPTMAIALAPGIAKLEPTPNYDPSVEEWEFPPDRSSHTKRETGMSGSRSDEFLSRDGWRALRNVRSVLGRAEPQAAAQRLVVVQSDKPPGRSP